jgi:hypothetical protein
MTTFIDMRQAALEIVKRMTKSPLQMHLLDAVVLHQWDRAYHLLAVLMEMPGDFGGMISLQCLILKLREGPTMDSMPAKQTEPPALHRCSDRVRRLQPRRMIVDDNEFNSLLS